MSRSDWHQLLRLREQSAAVWETVEAYRAGFNAARSDRARSEANAAPLRWSTTATAMYEAAEVEVVRNEATRVTRDGNNFVSVSTPAPKMRRSLDTSSHRRMVWTSQTKRHGNPARFPSTRLRWPNLQSLCLLRRNPAGRRGYRLQWNLGHPGLPCARCH